MSSFKPKPAPPAKAPKSAGAKSAPPKPMPSEPAATHKYLRPPPQNYLQSQPQRPSLCPPENVSQESTGADVTGLQSFAEQLRSHIGAVPAVQAKLTIGASGDPFEQEADRVAEAVMSGSQQAPQLDEDLKAPQLQRKEKHEGKKASGEKINGLKPGDAGRPLDSTVRRQIEPHLGHSLDDVRVHDGPEAQRQTEHLQARAFTSGEHIWLGRGESAGDTKLMAHETTHVVQQSRNKSAAIQRQETPGQQDGDTDLDADDDDVLLPDLDTDLGQSSGGAGDDPSDISDPDTPGDGDTPEQPVTPDGDADASRDGDTPGDGDGGPDAGDGGGGDDGGDAGEGRSGGGRGNGRSGATDTASDSALSGGDQAALGQLATSDLALIDEELAEHQRWGAAGAQVGGAESVQRAAFIAEAAGGGLLNGFAAGAAMGLGMGLVGRAAARYVPIPGVGAILAGGMSAYGLATRDWGHTGETISNFGEGASDYERLANSISAISEIIDVVTNVLNVLAGVIGVISAAMWIITVLTVGVAAPLAGTLSSIALGITAVTGILDGINAGLLQPLSLVFRTLHTFTSQADPRDVQADAAGISASAGAAGGAFGGFVGGRAANIGSGGGRGGNRRSDSDAPHADAPTRPASGDGPTVRYDAGPAPDAPTSSAGGAASRPVPPGFENSPGWVQRMAARGAANPDQPAWAQRLASPDNPLHTRLRPWAQRADRLNAFLDNPFASRRRAPAAPADTDAPATRPPQVDENGQYMLPGFDAPPPRAQADTPPTAAAPDSSAPVHNPNQLELDFTPQLELPFGAPQPPPHGFVDLANPRLHANWPFRQQVPNRASVGHNVQKDHVIAQGIMRDAMGSDYYIGPRPNNPRNRPRSHTASSLTVLAETGAISPTQAHPHTQATFRDVDADVTAIDRFRAQGGHGHTSDMLGSRLASRRRSGMEDESANAIAALDQLGRASQTRRMGERARVPVEDASGMPVIGPDGRPQMVDLVDSHRRPVESVADRLAELQMRHEGHVDPIPDIDSMNWSDFDSPVSSTPLQSHAPEQTPSPNNNEQLSFNFPEPAPPAAPDTPSVPQTPAAPDSTTVRPQAPATDLAVPRASGVPFTAAYQASRIAERERQGQQTQTPGNSGPPSLARQVGTMLLPQFFGPSGPPPTVEERHAAQNARFTSDNQLPGEAMAGVERVNPNYPDPPGTPQQLAAIQQEIENLFAARAQAEQAEQNMARQEQVCRADQAPIGEAVSEMGGAVSATQAHREAVARRQQLNQEQQQRQAESQGLVSGYPSRAAGRTALTGPLMAFNRVSSWLVDIRPPVGPAARKINRDSGNILDAFSRMDEAMSEQQAAGPTKTAQLASDGAALDATDSQAVTSQNDFELASTGANNLLQANENKLAEATEARGEARQQGRQLDNAVNLKQEQAQSLSQQLQSWAQAHKDARQRAIDETVQRLTAEGYTGVEASGE